MTKIQITHDDGFVISKELGEEPSPLDLLHEVYMMMLHSTYSEEQIHDAFHKIMGDL